MYCGRNGSTGDYWWWLASPSAYDAGYVCLVGGSGAGCLSINDYSYAYGLCPLVSLKSSFQLEIEQ